MIYVLAFLLVLTILVFIHELGHFVVARFHGVKVTIFSIGFGPEIVGWTDSKGTRWRLSCIPLGGYIRMLGDADETSCRPDPEVVKNLSEDERNQTVCSKRPAQRIAISAAGPIANLVLAWLMFWGVFVGKGFLVYPPQIEKVEPGKIAEQSGFQKGDRILSINNKPIHDFREMPILIFENRGKTAHFSIQRNAEVLTLPVNFFRIDPKTHKTHSIWELGITPISPVYHHCSILQGLGISLEATLRIAQQVVYSFARVFIDPTSRKQIGGIFSIGQGAGESFQKGWFTLLQFMAFISVNLGVLNLFPIPVLDGGQILVSSIEALIRRPLPEWFQTGLLYLGLAVVAGLMLLGMWNDIARLFHWT